MKSDYENFNTSHVEVYQITANKQIEYMFISIHLMLKFIVTTVKITDPVTVFQYISC